MNADLTNIDYSGVKNDKKNLVAFLNAPLRGYPPQPQFFLIKNSRYTSIFFFWCVCTF